MEDYLLHALIYVRDKCCNPHKKGFTKILHAYILLFEISWIRPSTYL